MIELTIASSGNKLTIVDHNSISFADISDGKSQANCLVLDGRHNNGGWRVCETYEEVKAKIIAANT